MSAKKLKFESLADMFTSFYNFSKGPKFAQLYTETNILLPKSSPYYGRVTKRSCINVQLNFNYTNAVNAQRSREGIEPTFQASPLKWGTRIEDTPLVMHTKKGDTKVSAYLMTRVLHTSRPGYFLDNNEILDIPTLAAILDDDDFPSSYSNAAHQGVEKEVIIRTYKLDSIMAITMDGETLVVEKEK